MAGESAAFPKRSQEHIGITHINTDEHDQRQPIEGVVPLATEIPVIDLRSLLAASSEPDLIHFRSALTSWGCFQVVNHGVESSLQDEVRRISREFFQLPLSEKKKYATRGGEDEGLGIDVLVVDDKFPDSSDNLGLRVLPEGHRDPDWSDNLGLRILPEGHRDPKYWPQNPKSFREVMVEYTNKVKVVKEEILKMVAKSLNLSDEEVFMKKTDTMYGRYNYYPPCPKSDQVVGLRQHADATVITVLLQDDKVGGLQLLKDDTWLAVPIIPNAFVILVGDQLEIMSNGIVKSIVHRALKVSSGTDRFTLAMFCAPDFDEEIGPLDELIDDERPRLFKNVANYIKFYYPYYHQGKRAIDALRI